MYYTTNTVTNHAPNLQEDSCTVGHCFSPEVRSGGLPGWRVRGEGPVRGRAAASVSVGRKGLSGPLALSCNAQLNNDKMWMQHIILYTCSIRCNKSTHYKKYLQDGVRWTSKWTIRHLMYCNTESPTHSVVKQAAICCVIQSWKESR